MSEQRLERMEEMLTTLVTMVGNVNSEQQSLRKDVDVIKSDINTLKSDVSMLKFDVDILKTEMAESSKKNEESHQEVLEGLKAIRIDQDFIWEKTVRNERTLGVLKKQIEMAEF